MPEATSQGIGKSVSNAFRRAAHAASDLLGSPWAFLASLALIGGWALSGPFFGFSGNWQLVVSTGTTIFTFLAVFLLQSAQNRDTKALHLKLDELIRSSEARNGLIHVESLTDDEMDRISRQLAECRASRRGGSVAELPSGEAQTGLEAPAGSSP